MKQHHCFIRWQGKRVELPIAFRTTGLAENFKLEAGPELMHYLQIGDQEVPVTCEPETPFRVGSEPAFAMVPEASSPTDTVAVSMPFWVAIGPVEQPGVVGPNANADELAEAGNGVAKRLKKLIAEGRVIDVQPTR